ncbi:sce7725 family protein [Geomicrobium sp. JCM 19037]|uniref:sce7725 family protein n=1 Tax=Geomicrobium sp. JCM 19037 TaxID=1460634 RepID=UPI0006933815|nr:sce7725 family protein [Geomicrobium sp. JCM 19037]
MYYPVLRGRQYDLIALRELQKLKLLSDKIIPIIEPIKISNTLISTVNEFDLKKRSLIIIINPMVGSLMGELKISSINQQFKDVVMKDVVKVLIASVIIL